MRAVHFAIHFTAVTAACWTAPTSAQFAPYTSQYRLANVTSAGVRTLLGQFDLDGDGRRDILLAQWGTPMQLVSNPAPGRFVVSTLIGLNCTNACAVAAGDLNGDGLNDLVYGDSASSVRIALSNGGGSFRQGQGLGAGATSLSITDLNGDGRNDVVAINRGGPSWFSINQGNATFATMPQLDPTPGTYRAVVSDFSGDGRPDLLVAGVDDANVGVQIYQPANVVFAGTALPPLGDSTVRITGVAAGQLTADTRPDAVVVSDDRTIKRAFLHVLENRLAAPVYLARTATSYRFETVFPASMETWAGSPVLADLTGDGKQDALVATASVDCRLIDGKTGAVTWNESCPSFALFPGDGQAGFLPPLKVEGARAAVGFGISDYNSDGRPDIALYSSRFNSIEVYTYDAPRDHLFEDGFALTTPDRR